MPKYVKTKKEWKAREWRISKSGRGHYTYYTKKVWDRKTIKSEDPDGKTRYRYPNVTPHHIKLRKISYRKQCLARDSYRCQMCGVTSDILHIHHKDGLGQGKTKKPDNGLSNLITLCPSCHFRCHDSHKIKLERVRKLKEMRDNGKTYQEIGEYFGVSRQRIHQLCSSV